MSSSTEAAYVDVPTVEHTGLSVIGGYGLCSFGLKYILAKVGLGFDICCSSIFAMVDSFVVFPIIVMYPNWISICVSFLRADSHVGLLINLW